MKIKVCGMKYPDNISELLNLQPDYVGFIFYEKSPRFVSDFPGMTGNLSNNIKKTGVFVNTPTDNIIRIANKYNLQAVQLHGNETPKECSILKKSNLEIIKAISVYESADLLQAGFYESCCDYLLFDTKTPDYGGSGKQYDRRILNEYQGNIPFFLSGGIGPDDVKHIINFQHPQFYGIDLNSRFETEPGLKDIDMLQAFFEKIRLK